MPVQLFPAGERGLKDIGWLQSHLTFSFSEFAAPNRSAFGSLVVFNDDFVAPGHGFGLHSHLNMEIISIMLKGSMNHKDNMGYVNVVQEDSVQIMSAGSGLYHEEHNVGTDEVNFLQIWIQPKQQNIRPRYQWRNFPKDKRRNQLVTIVSGEEGGGHCWINQNAKLSLGLFEASQQLNYTFRPVNMCCFVFVLEGVVETAGNVLNKRDALGLWGEDRFTIQCKEESQFLIIETPINQK